MEKIRYTIRYSVEKEEVKTTTISLSKEEYKKLDIKEFMDEELDILDYTYNTTDIGEDFIRINLLNETNGEFHKLIFTCKYYGDEQKSEITKEDLENIKKLLKDNFSDMVKLVSIHETHDLKYDREKYEVYGIRWMNMEDIEVYDIGDFVIRSKGTHNWELYNNFDENGEFIKDWDNYHGNLAIFEDFTDYGEEIK